MLLWLLASLVAVFVLIRFNSRQRLAETAAEAPMQARMMICGLGNPGILASTRHSVGAMALDYFVKSLNLQWSHHASLNADIAEDVTRGLVCVRPTHFMNINGSSVAAVCKRYRFTSYSHLLVLQDDVDREFGKLSMKNGGSASGHNGIRSIIQQLKTDQFPRLRIGIGRPENQSEVPVYVLQPFLSNERMLLQTSIFPKAQTQLLDWIEK